MKRKTLLQFLVPAAIMAVLSGCGGCCSCDCDKLAAEMAKCTHDLDSVKALVPGTTELTGEDGEGDAPPVIPTPGENTSVYYGALSPVYDMPGIYASKIADETKFAYVVVVTPHDATKKWTFSSVTDVADTLVYTFTSSSHLIAGVSVYVDDVVDVNGNKYIKAVCTGGGSSVSNVEHADDESTLAGSQGIPILWNRRKDASNLQSGGFIYGLIGKRPTLNDPVAGGAPADYQMKNTLTTPGGSVQYFQYVLQDWADPDGYSTKKKHKEYIDPASVSQRTTWFVR